jgi:hypothetical protein
MNTALHFCANPCTRPLHAHAPANERDSATAPPPPQVVQDAYEYHGLLDLALFTGFALLCTLVLFFHWEPTTATFKNTMQSSFVSWGRDDFAQTQLFEKGSIGEGYEYLTGYLGFYLNQSSALGWEEPLVRVDDYCDIVFARLLVRAAPMVGLCLLSVHPASLLPVQGVWCLHG